MMLYIKELPRTITREQWKKVFRWKRVTEKKLKEHMDELIKNLVVYGTTHPHFKADMLDKIDNPPLLVADINDILKDS